ncbi:restriction endonuclease subunit S [uncultured Tenacibaculum sp.]|uniref:restriction endonuclease subunit S n=1 Tax=uncultured Tenacibaculum sp. TaxID=174713 RepID=UPI00260A5AB2|nr:restriction endonuclease subunit S [uncultured Tenacibaculum sp.]
MAYHRYSKYKDCDIPWVKEIPQDWLVTEVRNVFSKNDIKNEKLEENNLLTLSYGSIKRKSINTAGGLLPASFDSYQILTKGMIVLRMLDLQNDKNSLRVGYVPERGIITSAYIGLDSKIECDTKYFYYLLHFMDLIKHFYNGGGGVRQSIGFTDFRREKIIIPSTSEQISIANFLDYKLEKTNRFITKKKQLIALLTEQKAAIINQAVTKGSDQNVPMKDSGIEWLGEIPEHWEVKPLKYFVTYNDEALPNSTDKSYKLNYIDISNVNKDGEIDEIIKYTFQDAPSRARRIVKKGDVILSTVRTYLKAIAKIENDEDVIVSTGFAVLRPRININSEFLNSAVRANYFIETVCANSFGVSYPAINASDLVTLKLAVPNSVQEQKEISHFIKTETSKIDKTISTIEKEITLVEEYKTALISEAVTGKIDVRSFKIPEKEESLAMVAEEASNYNKID